MDKELEKLLLEISAGKKIVKSEKIQSLWNGYGDLLRVSIEGGSLSSLIVKHIRFDSRRDQNSLSHLRKHKSYQVEMHWYGQWNRRNAGRHYTPRCYRTVENEGEWILVLEDLKDCGFPLRKNSAGKKEVSACLKWLACFHADYMGEEPEGLWKQGTYWHLDTRPEEWNGLRDIPLKEAAGRIDRMLREARYKTLVHGDAKLANFCFSNDGKSAAAVDFQYVGGGCGMKDLVYFIGSCFYDSDCERMEGPLLDEYFMYLERALKDRQKQDRPIKNLDIDALIKEWRDLYPIAWTDFHRFLKGWAGGSWDKNSYSEKISRRVLKEVLS